jgi:hypothetical protein
MRIPCKIAAGEIEIAIGKVLSPDNSGDDIFAA